MATKTLTPDEFVDALQSWTVLDVVNAVKLMEEKLGIKAAAPVAAAAPPGRRPLPLRPTSLVGACAGVVADPEGAPKTRQTALMGAEGRLRARFATIRDCARRRARPRAFLSGGTLAYGASCYHSRR